MEEKGKHKQFSPGITEAAHTFVSCQKTQLKHSEQTQVMYNRSIRITGFQVTGHFHQAPLKQTYLTGLLHVRNV